MIFVNLPIIQEDILLKDNSKLTRIRLDKITYYEPVKNKNQTLLYFDHCKTLLADLYIEQIDALFATFADYVTIQGIKDIYIDYSFEESAEIEEEEEAE